MTIQLAWDTDAPPGIDADALAAAGDAALAHGGRSDRLVDVVLVADATLTELHARFLGDDTPTDVMAFDLEGEKQEDAAEAEAEDGPSAEIYVSVDCARRVALERGVTLQRELALYVVHGCLHLCGLDDHEDADRARMREAEVTVLDALGYARDERVHESDA